MTFLQRHVLEISILLLTVAVHAFMLRRNRWRRAAVAGLLAILLFSLALDADLVARNFQLGFPETFRMFVLWYQMLALGFALSWFVDQRVFRPHANRSAAADRFAEQGAAMEINPTRRVLLTTARASLYAMPAMALGYGSFIERDAFELVETDITLAGLPKELEGLRILQITDVHMGRFLSTAEFSRVVAMANETKAHLALMTGDLITSYGDPLDDCIRMLAQVKADAGMIGCLGNHEIYAKAQDYVAPAAERFGIHFLRGEALALRFRGKMINFAGVDYQKKSEPYLVGAERLIRKDAAMNVLLSHNPDVFPVAVAKGFDFVSSGHTHGGQVRVEFLHQYVNPARFFTPYVSGQYRLADSALYVSRGVGTVAVPTRIMARPEVTLLRLRAGAPVGQQSLSAPAATSSEARG